MMAEKKKKRFAQNNPEVKSKKSLTVRLLADEGGV